MPISPRHELRLSSPSALSSASFAERGDNSLCVKIHDAYHVRSPFGGDLMNSFVVVTIGGESHKTGSVRSATHPRWEEEMRFRLVYGAGEVKIQVEVWDRGTTGTRLVGEGTVAAALVSREHTLALQNEKGQPAGSLHISLKVHDVVQHSLATVNGGSCLSPVKPRIAGRDRTSSPPLSPAVSALDKYDRAGIDTPLHTPRRGKEGKSIPFSINDNLVKKGRDVSLKVGVLKGKCFDDSMARRGSTLSDSSRVSCRLLYGDHVCFETAGVAIVNGEAVWSERFDVTLPLVALKEAVPVSLQLVAHSGQAASCHLGLSSLPLFMTGHSIEHKAVLHDVDGKEVLELLLQLTRVEFEGKYEDLLDERPRYRAPSRALEKLHFVALRCDSTAQTDPVQPEIDLKHVEYLCKKTTVLQEELKGSQLECERLRSDLSCSLHERLVLQGEVKALKESCDKASVQTEATQSENATLKVRLEQFKKEHQEQLGGTVERLELEVDALRKGEKKWKENMHSINNERDNFQAAVASLHLEIAILKSECDEQRAANERLALALGRTRDDRDQWKNEFQQINQMESECATLGKELASTRQDLELVLRERDALKSECLTAAAVRKEYEFMKLEVERLEVQQGRHLATEADLVTRIKQLEGDRSQLVVKENKSREDASRANGMEIESLTNRLQALQRQHAETQALAERRLTEVQYWQNERERFHEDGERLKEALTTAQQQSELAIKRATERMVELQEMADRNAGDLSRMQESEKAREAKYKELKNEYRKLKAEHKKMLAENDIRPLASEIGRLQSALKESEAQVAQRNEALKEVERALQQLQRAMQEREYGMDMKRVNEMKSQLELVSEHAREAQAVALSFKSLNEKSEDSLKREERRRTELVANIELLEHRVQSVENQRSEAETTVEEWKKKFRELTEKLNGVQQQRQQLTAQSVAQQDVIADLSQKLQEGTSQYVKSAAESETAKRAVEEQRLMCERERARADALESQKQSLEKALTECEQRKLDAERCVQNFRMECESLREQRRIAEQRLSEADAELRVERRRLHEGRDSCVKDLEARLRRAEGERLEANAELEKIKSSNFGRGGPNTLAAPTWPNDQSSRELGGSLGNPFALFASATRMGAQRHGSLGLEDEDRPVPPWKLQMTKFQEELNRLTQMQLNNNVNSFTSAPPNTSIESPSPPPSHPEKKRRSSDRHERETSPRSKFGFVSHTKHPERKEPSNSRRIGKRIELPASLQPPRDEDSDDNGFRTPRKEALIYSHRPSGPSVGSPRSPVLKNAVRARSPTVSPSRRHSDANSQKVRVFGQHPRTSKSRENRMMGRMA